MPTLFPTQIVQKKLKIPSKVHAELLKTTLKLSKIDDAGIRWCKTNYLKGYTSYGSMTDLHKNFSVFAELKDALDREVKTYVKSLGLKFETGKLQCSGIWVNIMPKDCYHAFHFHPLSVVSGTYYLQTPVGASPLRIEDPRSGLFMASPPRKTQEDLKPKTGDVILFESWLKHEVPPHSSSRDRVSVSFNYDWIDR